VADTGKGISQDNLPKIFEPSFTTKKEGHGIGLGIVSDIIKNHSGAIKVESKPGEGTVFTVELPLGA
jgi:two-component system NtrC family sensor kinase